MNMKYDFIKDNTSYDDYVEEAGVVKELTVTITLCEYRELIKNSATDKHTLDKLMAENMELHCRIAELTKEALNEQQE